MREISFYKVNDTRDINVCKKYRTQCVRLPMGTNKSFWNKNCAFCMWLNCSLRLAIAVRTGWSGTILSDFLNFSFLNYTPGRDERIYRAGYQVLTIVWIFIGLSWFAIVVTDISDIFKAKIEKRGTNVQRRKSHMSSSSKVGRDARACILDGIQIRTQTVQKYSSGLVSRSKFMYPRKIGSRWVRYLMT